jgi:hypothetical protein
MSGHKPWSKIKHKKDEEPESKSWLLPLEERKLLAKATPKEIVPCVECGEDAARTVANGKWRCTASKKLSPTVSVLTCGASGITMRDGDLVTTKAFLSRED